MFHHPIRAGLDAASLGAAIGVVTNSVPWILGVPSFIWSMVQITEWAISKYKSRKQK